MLIFWWVENVQLEAASLSQPGASGLAGMDKDALYPSGMQWPHCSSPQLAWVSVKQKGERSGFGALWLPIHILSAALSFLWVEARSSAFPAMSLQWSWSLSWVSSREWCETVETERSRAWEWDLVSAWLSLAVCEILFKSCHPFLSSFFSSMMWRARWSLVRNLRKWTLLLMTASPLLLVL